MTPNRGLIIPLPVIRRIERHDVDLAHQVARPSADRRNVVELRRVRELREFERRCRQTFGRAGVPKREPA